MIDTHDSDNEAIKQRFCQAEQTVHWPTELCEHLRVVGCIGLHRWRQLVVGFSVYVSLVPKSAFPTRTLEQTALVYVFGSCLCLCLCLYCSEENVDGTQQEAGFLFLMTTR